MPKLKIETAKLRAANLSKSFISSGCNQSEVARREGVTSQAINQRFKHLPVQTPLQEALRKIGITTVYKARKFKELMEAKSLNMKGKEVKDNDVRLGTLKLVCQVSKDIDNDNNKGGNTVVIVRIGSQSGLLSSDEKGSLINGLRESKVQE